MLRFLAALIAALAITTAPGPTGAALAAPPAGSEPGPQTEPPRPSDAASGGASAQAQPAQPAQPAPAATPAPTEEPPPRLALEIPDVPLPGPQELATPADTVRTLLQAVRDFERTDNVTYLDRAAYTFLPSPQATSRDERRELARKAAAVFEDFGDNVFAAVADFTTATGATRPTEVAAHPTEPFVLRLWMQKDEGVGFRFDPVVAQDVVRLYDALELDRLRALFYRWGMSVLVDREFIGVAYYQWVGLGLLILIAVLIDLLVQRLLLIAGTRYLDGESGELDKPTARNATLKVAKPVALAVAAAVFYFALPILSLPAGGESILRIAARFLGFAAFIWGAYRVIDLVAAVFRERTARTASTFDDLLVPLLTRAVKIFVIAFGVVLIAESLQLPITSLVAGLGIGGLAFAFAAKDTIENLFGSIAVILDRPFNVGDFVKVEGIEGIIESMGFRSTRIRTFHNSLVTLPNAMLVRATVDNFGARAYRRYKTHINLIYSTPPDKLEAFCEGIRDLVRKHPATRKDVYEIYVNELGPHSIDVLVYIFFVAPTWSIELRERHRFILDVIRLAKRLEVEFAFPTQTLVLERPGPAQPFAVRRPEPDSRDVGREAASEVLEGSEWRD